MKKNLLIACCILFSVSLYAQKIINNPAYGTSSQKNLSVEQVELNDTATILRMKIISDPAKFWSISKEAYIQTSGQNNRLEVKSSQGIGLGQRMYTQNGISRFTLSFPPVDTTSRQLDFIEGDCPSCFKIYGIDLSGKEIKDLYAGNEYAAVTKSPEETDVETGDTSNDNTMAHKPETQSSVTYDGSSYNLMFSWKKKAKNPHWTGAGMALANFSGLSGADLSVSTSYSFILNPIEYSVPIDHHWLFVSGAGIDWTRYHFKGNIGLEEDENGITRFTPAPEGTTYNSSKLLTYYITIPLLMEYQTKMSNRQTFFVSGGVVGYIKCYSKSQVDIKVEGGINKVNKGRDLNILPVNARFMLQAGISDISLYAYYSPFSLFEKDKGPDIKPIGIGIVLDF